MNFKSMNIRQKMTLSYSILIFLLICVVLISLSSLRHATEEFSHMVDGVQLRADLVASVRNSVDRRAIAARNMVLVTKHEEYEFEKKETIRAHEDTTQFLKKLNENIVNNKDVTPKDRQFVDEINRVETLYAPVALSILNLISENKRDAAVAKMNDECRPLLRQLINNARDYYIYSSEQKRFLVQDFYKSYNDQRLVLTSVAILAGVLALIMGWFTTRSIVAPIDTAVSFADTVARGDLRTFVASQSNNETGRLLCSLNTMNTQLTATVRQVRDSSINIANASREMASGNTDLSCRTEKQAASLQETAASMQQLTISARQNTENAREASNLTKETSLTAEHGNAVVGRVVETMQSISMNSSEIGKITGVIEGIAFQTNILALNAAVEAARAGENGRGFAVVATEVRNLAHRSSGAAKEIKDLLARSLTQVEEGVCCAKEAGEAVESILRSVATVSSLTAGIAMASEEQCLGIDQINQAIGQMDQVTQQNAALVEQAAAASHALQQQGRDLEQAVLVFQLN